MKPDWIIHYIIGGQPSSHTHGLNKYGSLELELNIPFDQRTVGMLLNLIGLEIATKHKRYQSGDRETDVFNWPIYFLETAPVIPDGNADRILRVLVCDPGGKYPWEDGCVEPYTRQLSSSEKQKMRILCWRRYGATDN